MGTGRGRDDQGVYPGAQQFGHRPGGLRSVLPCDLLRPFGVGIGNDQRVDPGQPAERSGVECADSSDPDESDAHVAPLRCRVVWFQSLVAHSEYVKMMS